MQVPPSKAYAQAASATASQPTAESVELQAVRQQVKLLETQLQITKDFQSAILDTIYWALGGVFLALSLVFGFSWFPNFRLYDRDKQALHADLQSRTDAALKEPQAEVSRAGLSVDRRLDEKLAEFTRSTEFQVENAQERRKTDSQARASRLSNVAMQAFSVRSFASKFVQSPIWLSAWCWRSACSTTPRKLHPMRYRTLLPRYFARLRMAQNSAHGRSLHLI